ncbi:MAG: hypothetical protein AB8G05_03480 [Oligoflexales bacterium]
MGKVYLILVIIFSSNFLLPSVFGKDRIILAPNPEPVVPPPPDKEQSQQDLQRLRKRRKKRKGGNISRYKYFQNKRNQQLVKDSEKKGPYQFMTQTSLVLPAILARGPRSNYTSELSAHISTFFRLSPDEEPFSQQYWWGIRIAPFAGTGNYQETAGRYNFFYFGPMIGIGSLSRSLETDQKENNGIVTRSNKNTPKTNGWFLMGGIAAHTRIVQVDPTDDIADKEMNTIKSAKLDGTGLWVEFTYANIYFGSLGAHYVAGVQLGEEKVFLWLGVGAGGWY